MLKKLSRLLTLYQATRHGYGPDHSPYGYGRPHGLKAVLIDAVVRKLLKQH